MFDLLVDVRPGQVFTDHSLLQFLQGLGRQALDRLVDSLPPAPDQSQCRLPRLASVGSKVRFVQPLTAAELNSVHEPGRPPATLREFIPHYAAERGIRPRTIESIEHRLTRLEKMLGRPATLADLNDTIMNL